MTQLKALLLLFVMAALMVAGFLLYKVGRADGMKLERVAWQDRELKEVASANAKIIDLTTRARAAEKNGAENVAVIGMDLEKEKRAHEKTEAARRLALLSGAERVSVAVTGCQDPGRGAGSEAPAGAGEPPAARAFLHPQVAADLEQLAGEADDTARDLNACLAVVAEDRRIVNGQ